MNIELTHRIPAAGRKIPGTALFLESSSAEALVIIRTMPHVYRVYPMSGARALNVLNGDSVLEVGPAAATQLTINTMGEDLTAQAVNNALAEANLARVLALPLHYVGTDPSKSRRRDAYRRAVSACGAKALA